ncbi:hypothetical protein HIM_07517 [Hirsutella minnesotensis 3608]|uniref:Nudix hydrolase domain-containing protein n=1 Tax=Hirsutella minnesotensis 3608 TaxID=1043627 RepID=A0A0F7ZTH7_9HYPO|nr:hypothetical protein HIM_07517 [Hirsutella minnesotensis 3608]
MEPKSATRATTSTAPKTFQVSPCVAEFSISTSEYLRLNPSISGLAVGAVLFSGDRLLLIQRASDDFAPLMWEVPGGACEADKDATILDSVARELWEETGLHLRRVKRHVDNVEFSDDGLHGFIWRKLTFEVEVDEGYGLGLAESRDTISAAVKPDPAEHQDWGWARMAEVEERKWEKGRLQLMEVQRGTMLTAFGFAR